MHAYLCCSFPRSYLPPIPAQASSDLGVNLLARMTRSTVSDKRKTADGSDPTQLTLKRQLSARHVMVLQSGKGAAPTLISEEDGSSPPVSNEFQHKEAVWDEEGRLLAMQVTYHKKMLTLFWTNQVDICFRTQNISLNAQMALKWADIGHLASPLEVHLRWVKQLEEEMFQQGDQERLSDLPVSPLMDRNGQGITKSQTGVRLTSSPRPPDYNPVSLPIHVVQFFNFVALPMYQPMVQAFPGCLPMLEAVKANYAYWAEREQQGK